MLCWRSEHDTGRRSAHCAETCHGRERNALPAFIKSIGKVLKVPVVATQIETAALAAQAIAAGIELLQAYSICPGLAAGAAEQSLRSKTGDAV